MLLAPPTTSAADAGPLLRERGFAVLGPQAVCELAACERADLRALDASWNDLPPDGYLKDGGRYRRRRHSCFVLEGGVLTQVPHRAHWQPVEYNALHGGMQRWFEPVEPQVVATPAWEGVLRAVGPSQRRQ